MECQACLRRCLWAVTAAHRITLSRTTPRRTISTAAKSSLDQEHKELHQPQFNHAPPSAADSQLKSRKKWSEPDQHAKRRIEERAKLEAINLGAITPKTMKQIKEANIEADFNPSYLLAELKYLRDPLKLADHVRYVLQKGDEEKALALVRLASKARATTVSWNHVIDWQLRQGKVRAAMDTYNELKKRNQRPDSYTYLLLLRGLADNAKNPTSLGKALSLYHSMWAPNSKVVPTIIHTNAVLKVCARANDIDSMWDIASRLPEKGPNAADSWTFTTILNNMRLNATTTPIPDDTSNERSRRADPVVIEGRKLWNIIAQRWFRGDLEIDEELVCSMGRLLLAGSKARDSDDILSLIHQTMGIPRQLPRLGTSERPNSLAPRARLSDSHESADKTKQETVETAVAEGIDEAHAGNEFEPFRTSTSSATGSILSKSKLKPTTHLPRANAFSYAQPGNSTLSLLLEACLNMVEKKAAQRYWSLLTETGSHAVRPDLDNATMYLRVLRRSRASAEALKFLRDDFLSELKLKPKNKTFRIAASACLRDSNNQKAINHALEVFSLMQRELETPDAMTMSMVMQTAKLCEDPKMLKLTLERLEPATANLRNLLSFGRPGMLMGDRNEQEERHETLELLKELISAFDQLLLRYNGGGSGDGAAAAAPDSSPSTGKQADGGALLTQVEVQTLSQKRSKLAAYVTMAANKEARRRQLVSSLSPNSQSRRKNSMYAKHAEKLAAKHARADAEALEQDVKNRESHKPIRSPKAWLYTK